jgi:hypothetical protein
MKRLSVVLGLAVPTLLALPLPGAKAGTYELEWVSYYSTTPISSPIYTVSGSQNSLTVTAQATGSGTGNSENCWASGYLGLEGYAYAYVSKGYRWQGTSADWHGPADYKATYRTIIDGSSSVQVTGSCYANATGSLNGHNIANNTSVNRDDTWEWISDGWETVSVSNGVSVQTRLDAGTGNGTLAASITQSGTVDVYIEAVPTPEE